MKKFLFSIIITMLLFGIINVFAEENITVKVNGEVITFDVAPQVISDRTMVPMRKIFESLGAGVYYDESNQTIYAGKDNMEIKLIIDDPHIYINNQKYFLEISPYIFNDRTFVPLRAISETFNMNVDWIEETQTVLIYNANADPEVFERLKYRIIEKGQWRKIYYEFPNSTSTNKIYCIAEYDNIEELVNISYISENLTENYRFSATVTVYPNSNPLYYVVFEYPGTEFFENLLGEYKKPNEKYSLISMNLMNPSHSDLFVDLANDSLEVLDLFLEYKFYGNLSDLGVTM